MRRFAAVWIEQDMNRLYEASAFGAPCDDILWEDEGINLFAVGIK